MTAFSHRRNPLFALFAAHILAKMLSRSSSSSSSLFVSSFCRSSRGAAAGARTVATFAAATDKVCDVIVVGGGSAGLTAAKLASDTLQKECILIEADRMGGDCTWTGCVPSKSLIAAAKSVHSAKQYGLLTNNNVNLRAIRTQLQANIQQIYNEDDSPETLQKLGVQAVAGRAVMETPTSVRVNQESGSSFCVTAREGIILCTGAQPAIPTSSIDGLDQINYWTYENVWDLEKLPDRLTVIGGGPIGCELAQAFARLGSQVTMVVGSRSLLPREDPAVAHVLTQVFQEEGIRIVAGRATAVQTSSDGSTVVACDNAVEIATDQVLVAAGRVPRCQGMNLQKVGVELTPDGAAIQVNEKLQTTVKNIYAAGDCTGGRQFTHLAGYQGAIAARNILLPLTDPGVLETVPSTTFTSPEVASIGLSEAAAKEKYGSDKIVVVEQALSHVDRAVCEVAQPGFMKIVYLKRGGKVVGATIVAPVAGELISEMAVIIKTGMPFDQLATIMHPYPTYAFGLQLLAADAYYKKTLKMKWLLDILKKIGL